MPIKYSPRNKKSVDAQHTHFIFVDDGRVGFNGGEIDFRAEFEKQARRSIENCEVVVVVVEGRPVMLGPLPLSLNIL